MAESEKIGVGIVTCNRPEFLKNLLASIASCTFVDLIIVNDGDRINNLPGCNYYLVNNDTNLGVAKSKNIAMQYLLDKGCEHIFIIEDDMLILDCGIFDAYIKASKVSGIQHMMFGYHGPANKNGISKGTPSPRLVVKYSDDVSIALNMHCVGAFCYYTKESLDECGLIDENFKNAFDHVSHSYELALNGYSTPYWWWADLANSLDYIKEQACSEENSSIKTPKSIEKWQNNIQSSIEYFKNKFGVYPFGKGGVSDTQEKNVLNFLKNKKNN